MARITFRQGIVRHGKSPRQVFFLQQSTQHVNLVVSPELTVIAFADGDKDYLFTESVTTLDAWGPFPDGVQDYWLYWDINRITGVRTFGSTTLTPVYELTAPSTPATGQMWFDTSTGGATSKMMQEFNGAVWVQVLRTFACKYLGGIFHSPVDGVSIETNFTGTQAVGVGNVTTDVGSLAFDKAGKPIVNQNGKFFTTEDVFTTGVPTGASLKVNDILLRAQATQNIAAYGVVVFSDYDKMEKASPFDVLDKIYGVVEETAVINDTVNVVMDGVIFNEAWDFTDVGNNPNMSGVINDPIYITATGELTTNIALSTPTSIPIGAIIGQQTILFRPGVYDAPESLQHGDLIGLADDDHKDVYFNETRGDNRYYTKTAANLVFSPLVHTHVKADIDDFAHTHLEADVTDLDRYTQAVVDNLLLTKVSVDGSIAMTGALTLPGDPASALEAATKQYVDTLASGIDPKDSVEVATTADIGGAYSPVGGGPGTGEFTGVDLSAIDGTEGVDYVVAVNTRILVKDQTDAKENGIYVVSAQASSPLFSTLERAPDMDGNPTSEISPGNYTFTAAGAINDGTGWIILAGTATGPADTIVLNTDNINWSQISASIAYTAGNNINIDGSSVISVKDVIDGGTVDALTWNGEAVNISISPGPADNQVMVYDSGVPEWKNDYLSFIRNFSDTSNVTVNLGTDEITLTTVAASAAATIASGAALTLTSVGNTNITATLALNLNSTGNTTLVAGTSSILLNNATDITLTSDNVVVTPTSGNATIKLKSGIYTTTFAAGTLGAATQFILPITNGTAGFVLSTDGAGVTSWIADTTLTTLDTLTDVVYTASPSPLTNEALIFNGTNWENQVIDHVNLSNIGTNTHSQIDTHIAGTTLKHTAEDIINAPLGDIGATDVQAAIDELDTEKAPLASPALTGTPTTPVPSVDDSSAQIPTTSWVQAELAALTLEDISDVVYAGSPSPSTDEALIFNGTNWENQVQTAPVTVTDRHATADITDAVANDAIYVTGDPVTTPGQEVLNPFPGDGGDQFGWMVSLSDDGTRCLVGARWDDTGTGGSPILSGQGAASIYLKTGTTWAFEADLINPDPTIADYFGSALMISGDGTRCVIGAYNDDAGASNSGSVYVYNRVGTTWTLDTGGTIPNPVALIGAAFGTSVAINDVGDKLMASAPNAAPGAVTDAGACYIYSRSGEVWSLEQTINNPDAIANDFFGSHIEMSNDGLRVEMSANDVGNNNDGKVYIYRRDAGGTVWSLEATILNPDVGNDAAFARFGWSTRFDATADRMVVGVPQGNDEPQANRGLMYVFKRIGTEWIQEQKILNPNPTGPIGYGDRFGNRVDISGDGLRIIAGSWADEAYAGLDAGTSYLYGVKDGVWDLEQEIVNPRTPPSSFDFFGGAVAIDFDGTTICIGAYGIDPALYAGAVYFYEAPILDITIPSSPTAFDEINIHNTRVAPIQITDTSNKLKGSLGTYSVTRETTVILKYIDGTVGWLVIEN